MFTHHSSIIQCTAASLFIPRRLSLFASPYPVPFLAAVCLASFPRFSLSPPSPLPFTPSPLCLSHPYLVFPLPLRLCPTPLPLRSPVFELFLRLLASPSSLLHLFFFALPLRSLRLPAPPSPPSRLSRGGAGYGRRRRPIAPGELRARLSVRRPGRRSLSPRTSRRSLITRYVILVQYDSGRRVGQCLLLFHPGLI